MRSRALNVDSKEARVSEVGVDGGGSINELVLLHEVGNSSAVHALAGTSRREGSSASNESVHEVEGRDVFVAPWDGLKSEGDGSSRRLSPGSGFTTNVLRRGSLVLVHVLRYSKVVSKSLLHEVDVLSVVLDTRSDDEALLGGDVVHNELLEDAGIEVGDVVLHSVARHAKGVVTVGSSEEHLLLVSEWVKFSKMLEELMRLGVL